MLCNGAGFEVKRATNYNFNRDFSIAMTFAAQDVNTAQGLLYKGTGSDITSPELSMSYRVGIANRAVTLSLTDGTLLTDGASAITNPPFAGLAVLKPDTFYQVIIVKQTIAPVGNSDPGSHPYAPPFDASEFENSAAGGAKFKGQGIGGSGDMQIAGITPGDPSTSNLNTFLTNIQKGPNAQASKGYQITISVREVPDDGSPPPPWQTSNLPPVTGLTDTQLLVNSTGPRALAYRSGL